MFEIFHNRAGKKQQNKGKLESTKETVVTREKSC